MEKLERILNVLGSATSVRYSNSLVIRDLFLAGVLQLISGEYYRELDKKYKDFAADVKNPDKWSTYDRCTVTKLSATDKGIIVTVEIYEGDVLYGRMEELRWSAEFGYLQPEYLKTFESLIESRWDYYLDEQFEQEEVERRNKRKQEIAAAILAD